MLDQPVDILNIIISYLDAKSLVNFSLLNQKFYKISKNQLQINKKNYIQTIIRDKCFSMLHSTILKKSLTNKELKGLFEYTDKAVILWYYFPDDIAIFLFYYLLTENLAINGQVLGESMETQGRLGIQMFSATYETIVKSISNFKYTEFRGEFKLNENICQLNSYFLKLLGTNISEQEINRKKKLFSDIYFGSKIRYYEYYFTVLELQNRVDKYFKVVIDQLLTFF